MALSPELKQKIEDQLKGNRVVLYMKGNRQIPMCGFSARTVAILEETGTDFQEYNILEDEELRQGLKEYSEWPTYPQLYVDGELVGGCDIVMEMYESGDLQKMLAPAAAP